MSNYGNFIYTPNDTQKKDIIKMFELVTTSFKEFLLDNIPGDVQMKKRKVSDSKILSDHIMSSARNGDKIFTE